MRKPNKTFCKRCFLHKRLEEMTGNVAYGLGYKYLCKSCESLDAKRRKNGNRQVVPDNSNGLKFCETCNEIKTPNEMVFYKKTQKCANVCKKCRTQYKVDYKNVNREHLNELNRKSYSNNSSILRIKRQSQKLEKAEYDKKNRKFRNRDLKKERIRDKERRNSDPFYHTKFYLRRRIRKALSAKGYTKKSSTNSILGTSWDGLVCYFRENQRIDILNTEDMKGKHVDHICPLAQAQNEIELIKLCHYTNLRIICAIENVKKSKSKTPDGEIKCLELLNREWIEYEY